MSITRFPIAGFEAGGGGSSSAAGTVTPETYGAVGNGTTDDTAAVQAAMAALAAAGGGAVLATPGKTYRCDGQLVHPGGYIRITSAAGSTAYFEFGEIADDGPILDLRYSGTGAKFNCKVKGTLEIDRVAVVDRGLSATRWFFFSRCQPRIHDAYFQGNVTLSGDECNQDVFVIGGTTPVQDQTSDDSAFAGYGGFIRDNGFSHIRRAVTLGCFANALVVDNNAIDTTCGSDQPIDAPIVLDGGADDPANHCMGNTISSNILEIKSAYSYGVWLRNQAKTNVIRDNGYWDAVEGGASVYLADVHIEEDTGCTENTVLQTGYTQYRRVTGIVFGGGGNYVSGFGDTSIAGQNWVAPAGWRLNLQGDVNGGQSLGYSVVPDGPVLTGWAGVGIRNMQGGGAGILTSLRTTAASPNGVITGNPGDLCLSSDGTVWRKRSDTDNTGWARLGCPTVATAQRTAGSLDLTGTAWADVDTSLDLVLPAQVGDTIEVSLSALIGDQAAWLYLDAVTLVADDPVNSLTSGAAPGGTASGNAGWLGAINTWASVGGGPAPYVLQAGDISGGNVTVRLRYRTEDLVTTKTLLGTADIPLIFSAKNLG